VFMWIEILLWVTCSSILGLKSCYVGEGYRSSPQSPNKNFGVPPWNKLRMFSSKAALFIIHDNLPVLFLKSYVVGNYFINISSKFWVDKCNRCSRVLSSQAVYLCYMCIYILHNISLWAGSSVGIATDLRAGWSGDRIPVGTRFSAPVQTGPGAHPASSTMGTGSFPEVKYGRGVLLTSHPLLVPRSRKGRAVPLPNLWATPGL
jgi:hypothetical protein